MTDGLIVRVTTDIAAGDGPAVALYAVAQDTSDDAIAAVRPLVPEGWRIKGVIGPVSADTLQRLGIETGGAHRL